MRSHALRVLGAHAALATESHCHSLAPAPLISSIVLLTCWVRRVMFALSTRSTGLARWMDLYIRSVESGIAYSELVDPIALPTDLCDRPGL